jgi:hypothetical protein
LLSLEKGKIRIPLDLTKELVITETCPHGECLLGQLDRSGLQKRKGLGRNLAARLRRNFGRRGTDRFARRREIFRGSHITTLHCATVFTDLLTENRIDPIDENASIHRLEE